LKRVREVYYGKNAAGESEWTMMRNMTYRVRKVEQVNGRWRVHVDVVGRWDDQGRMIPDFSLPVVAGASSGEYEKMAMAEYLKLNGH
jgi:hypothetical protein